MQTYELLVVNRAIRGNSEDMSLVRRSVGIDRVHVMFDNAEWLDFAIEAVFANSAQDEAYAVPLAVTVLEDSDWVAEATCDIPWEVATDAGSVRVTFRGKKADGSYIITERSSPISVDECGDYDDASAPSDAPTLDQWTQAYASAMAAVGQLQSALTAANEAAQAASAAAQAVSADAGAAIDAAVADAVAAVGESIEALRTPATEDDIGMVRPDGDTLSVDDDGTLRVLTSATSADVPIADIGQPGVVMPDGETLSVDDEGMMSVVAMPPAIDSAVESLAQALDMAFDSDFNEDGDLEAMELRPTAAPVASESALGCVKPDGTTVTVDDDGTVRSVVPVANSSRVGGVKPDGSTITVDADGTAHAIDREYTAGEGISISDAGSVAVLPRYNLGFVESGGLTYLEVKYPGYFVQTIHPNGPGITVVNQATGQNYASGEPYAAQPGNWGIKLNLGDGLTTDSENNIVVDMDYIKEQIGGGE